MAAMHKGNMALGLSRDYSEHTDFTLPHTDRLVLMLLNVSVLLVWISTRSSLFVSKCFKPRTRQEDSKLNAFTSSKEHH